MNKLFNKYKIEKTDGSPVDPKAEYFVLRVDTDPVARAALWTYAAYCEDREFAEQLRRWVLNHNTGKEIFVVHENKITKPEKEEL